MADPHINPLMPTSEFTKAERKLLRELADAVYETEAKAFLAELDAQFTRWRDGEIRSFELLEAIHDFQRGPARELWSMYQSMQEPMIVARGIALGLIEEGQVPASTRKKLLPFG